MRSILFIAFICSCTFLSAQKSHPVFIKADLGLSNVKTSSGKGSMNFALGIGLESYIPINKSTDFDISLNPALSYLKTGYESSTGGKVVVNYINLAVPLCFVVNQVGSGEGVGLVFGVGPYVGYAVAGKFQIYTIDPYKKMSFGNGTADNRTSLDAGITLKSCLRIVRFNFGTQYNIGTANLVPKDRITNGAYIKSRNFLFYVSYALKGKKK